LNEKVEEKIQRAEEEEHLNPREDKEEGEDKQHDSHVHGQANGGEREDNDGERRDNSKEVEHPSIAGEIEERDAHSHGACNKECTNTWKNTIACNKGKCNFCATMFYECKCKGVALAAKKGAKNRKNQHTKGSGADSKGPIQKLEEIHEEKEARAPEEVDQRLEKSHEEKQPQHAPEEVDQRLEKSHEEKQPQHDRGHMVNPKRKQKKRDEHVEGQFEKVDEEPEEGTRGDEIEGIIPGEKEDRERYEDAIDAKEIAHTCNLELSEKASFMALDTHRDGKLEDEEIAKFFDVRASDVAMAIKQFDNNGDGMLDKEEFVNFKLHGDPDHSTPHVKFDHGKYWIQILNGVEGIDMIR